MQQKILESGNPLLREKSVKVKKIDKKIKQLIIDLKDTLKAQSDPEGVGLAAPQIGKKLRMFLISYEGVEKIIINPEIITVKKLESKAKKRKRSILEGCLSLPHYYGPLVRSPKIKIKYLTEGGVKTEEEFTGFYAQIVQHEIDHLNGILFIDHIIKEKKPLYKVHGDDWEEVELT